MANEKRSRGALSLGNVPADRIVISDFQRPDPDIVAGFQQLEDLTCTVSDVLDELGVTGAIPGSVLSPISRGQRLAGPAITLRNVPESRVPKYGYDRHERSLMGDRDVYDLAMPGDILVIDSGGAAGISNMGGLSATMAQRSGLAGAVVDGGIRDIDGIRSISFPVWSRGVTPISGKFRLEAAEIGGTVELAGLRVRPGDLVLADGSGVVVVPLEFVARVLDLARQAEEREARLFRAIAEGKPAAELRSILHPSNW